MLINVLNICIIIFRNPLFKIKILRWRCVINFLRFWQFFFIPSYRLFIMSRWSAWSTSFCLHLLFKSWLERGRRWGSSTIQLRRKKARINKTYLSYDYIMISDWIDKVLLYIDTSVVWKLIYSKFNRIATKQSPRVHVYKNSIKGIFSYYPNLRKCSYISKNIN